MHLFHLIKRLRAALAIGIVAAVLLRGTVAGKWNYKGKTLTVTQFGELSERDKRAIFAQAGIQWPSVSKIVFI
mgnify:CR=1 FL=1